ncbi:MAG: hypothetical protein ACO1NX_03770 [Chitinophagaceae bacterium]
MKRAAIEKRIVVVLFVLVLATFSLAQHDSRHFKYFSASVASKVEQVVAYLTPGK